MKFETVRVHFFGEDFRCRCRRGCLLFFCLFVSFSSFFCQLLVIGINSMLIFLLVTFMNNLFLFCVNRMPGMERSLFSPVMTTTMIRKAKI